VIGHKLAANLTNHEHCCNLSPVLNVNNQQLCHFPVGNEDAILTISVYGFVVFSVL